MIDDYIQTAHFMQKWFIHYYNNYREEFVPMFRNFYDQLQLYNKPIPRQFIELYMQYVIKTRIRLWSYELYSITYASYIQEFSIFFDGISRQRDYLFKRGGGGSSGMME